MKNNTSYLINQPPALTYSWLGTGGAPIEKPVFTGEISWQEERHADLFFSRQTLSPSEGGAEDILKDQDISLPLNRYHLSEGVKASDALRLDFSCGNDTAGLFDLHLEAESELTAVMDFAAEQDKQSAVRTGIHLAKGALLRLVQISRGESRLTLFNELLITAEEGARCELIRLVLGGGKTYDRVLVSLNGEKSRFECETAYRLANAQELDMNYEILHFGRHTESDIRAAGVLADKAYKIFRGAIDLKKGCSGSAGSETEDVLMLDDTVRNKTLPVILCGEEDVTGNHGATIGRLDEALVYYMESRGMDREAIYEAVASARIEHAIRRIPDEKTVRRLFPNIWEEA